MNEPEVFENSGKNEPEPLIEGIDFHLENGLMVLTEAYLLKRGYCCGNACRHCPYRHINVPDHNK